MKIYILLLSSFLLVGCGDVREDLIGDTHVTPFDNNIFTTEFKEVKECVKMEAPAPNVAVIKSEYWSWEGLTGLYDGYSLIIFIKEHHLETVRHEFVHYLLHINTGNLDDSHTSYLFIKCGVGN